MAVSLFDQVKTGSGTVGSNVWIDLGVIPTGYRLWFGSWTTTAAKACSFYLYTNTTGKSSGAVADCTKIALISSKAGATVTQDLYKRGTLHTVSIYGTGVEKCWLYITSKSSTVAAYNYKIIYTTE
jgi:hypothetical protein